MEYNQHKESSRKYKALDFSIAFVLLSTIALIGIDNDERKKDVIPLEDFTFFEEHAAPILEEINVDYTFEDGTILLNSDDIEKIKDHESFSNKGYKYTTISNLLKGKLWDYPIYSRYITNKVDDEYYTSFSINYLKRPTLDKEGEQSYKYFLDNISKYKLSPLDDDAFKDKFAYDFSKENTGETTFVNQWKTQDNKKFKMFNYDNSSIVTSNELDNSNIAHRALFFLGLAISIIGAFGVTIVSKSMSVLFTIRKETVGTEFFKHLFGFYKRKKTTSNKKMKENVADHLNKVINKKDKELLAKNNTLTNKNTNNHSIKINND